MRTLIVDQEPGACANLRHLCEAAANIDEVAVADSGMAALEMIRSGRPDLLLPDSRCRANTRVRRIR
jgi:CheY-like chemotaxis protein